MKVTAFVGSARKAHTWGAAESFLKELEEQSGADWEIVRLSDYRLKPCSGCKLCTDKGEELCPLDDDRDVLIRKLEASDGVVFASPNYSFGVSAHMKLFLDKLAYLFHRPRMFGKTYTAIVTQGIYGGRKITKYLEFIGKAMGFNVVPGTCLNTLEPQTEKLILRNRRKMDDLSRRFRRRLERNPFPRPSLMDLMVFRMGRSKMKSMLSDEYRDVAYYREKGWFESDFYYPVRLGPLMKLAGRILDRIAIGL